MMNFNMMKRLATVSCRSGGKHFLPSFSIFEIMHGIFAHACRYEWLLNNPISLVRQEREAGENA